MYLPLLLHICLYALVDFLYKGVKMDNKKEDFTLSEIVESDVLEKAKEKSKDFLKLMTYYKCAMMEIETKLNVMKEEFALSHDRSPIKNISARMKTPQAIWEKLNRYGKPQNLSAAEEFINDIAGVRVTCSFIEDVYMLVDSILSQDDITLVAKKDYIANPKPNGYRSLHLIVSVPIFLINEKRTVKVEIQFRTIAMDFWASVEHQLRYKKDYEFTEEMAEELLNCAKISADLDERMGRLKQMIEK